MNFLCRICRACLPTSAALVVKNVRIGMIFPWCSQIHVEDAVHILFKCEFAQEVWVAVGLPDLVTIEINDPVFETFQRIFCKGTKEQCALVGLFC